jgi:hypothetical protein
MENIPLMRIKTARMKNSMGNSDAQKYKKGNTYALSMAMTA